MWGDQRPPTACAGGQEAGGPYGHAPPGWGAPPAPPHDRWEATATFRTPGTYVLRAWADDGGLMSYFDVTVEVTGDAAAQDQ